MAVKSSEADVELDDAEPHDVCRDSVRAGSRGDDCPWAMRSLNFSPEVAGADGAEAGAVTRNELMNNRSAESAIVTVQCNSAILRKKE